MNMQLQFNAVSEPSKPGVKWQNLFNTHWPAYKAWLHSKETANVPDLKTSQAALKKYMPEMWPTYKRLCKIVNADDAAARFLTGFQPPAYISACSQAVTSGEEIQLVRNYDYHPHLMEGTQLLSAWNGKKVIATSDCLIGAVDGMNDDGLAISLTFGGRKQVGVGFGIPFILRYVLEFCSNVDEAVSALVRIPSHMSYNITVVDKTGSFKTVRLAPDREPVITSSPIATNHQGLVDWPENAAFNKTVERYQFLKNRVSGQKTSASDMANAFLQPPLYNKLFKEGFGTLFTAIYKPEEGSVELRWPLVNVHQTFDNFQEIQKVINYEQQLATPVPNLSVVQTPAKIRPEVIRKLKQPVEPQFEWQETVTRTLVVAMAQANPSADLERLEAFRGKLLNQGEIHWGAIANFWSNTGTGYWENWRN